MSAFLDHLASERPCLIVSLPRNEPDLARAAIDAGAQALKVHAGVYHHATGVRFAPLPDELPRLEAILQVADGRVPVGVVPGDPQDVTPDVLADLARRGFAFTDAYAHLLRASALGSHGLEVWVAPEIEAGYSDAEIGALARLPGVAAMEAVVVPHAEYGSPLTVRDLAAYAHLVSLVGGLPLVVPSQRRLVPEDVELLHRVSLTNVMIGAVVVGLDARSLETAVRSFRQAMERLAPAAAQSR